MSNGYYIYIYTYSNLQPVTSYSKPPSSLYFNDNSLQISVNFTLLEDRVRLFFV